MNVDIQTINWAPRLFIMLALALPAITVPGAAEAQPKFCLLNRAPVVLHYEYKVRATNALGQRIWRTKYHGIQPNASSCCVDCADNIRVFLDTYQTSKVVTGLKGGAALFKKLAKLRGPTGADLRSNYFVYLCDIQNLTNGMWTELHQSGDRVRCDVVSSDGYYRYSRDRRGNATAPEAGFKFCNKQSKPVFAAIAFAVRKRWRVIGWYEVPGNRCEHVPLGPGYRGLAYWYAERGSKTFSGKYPLCTHPTKSFDYADGLATCQGGGKKTFSFREATFREGKNVVLNLD